MKTGQAIVITLMMLTAACGTLSRDRTAGTATEGTTVAAAAVNDGGVPAIRAAEPGREHRPQEEAAGHVWDFRDATTWLLGEMKPSMLLNAPHDTWYLSEYAGYQPDETVMAQLTAQPADDISITVVLGTWCPDSRREVPRFMKIIDLWGFPMERMRFIGVDINKVAPLEDYFLLQIERVPTFVFFRKNVELGRIIEVPVASLEQDMEMILEKTKEH